MIYAKGLIVKRKEIGGGLAISSQQSAIRIGIRRSLLQKDNGDCV